jgi:hypothetical protein
VLLRNTVSQMVYKHAISTGAGHLARAGSKLRRASRPFAGPRARLVYHRSVAAAWGAGRAK